MAACFCKLFWNFGIVGNTVEAKFLFQEPVCLFVFANGHDLLILNTPII